MRNKDEQEKQRQLKRRTMSRRSFLASSGAGMGASLALGAVAGAAPTDPKALGEYVDLAAFRPRPEVRIAGATVRIKPPYWLGWPGTAYDVEGMRVRYNEYFAGAAKRVGVNLQLEEAPLESEEQVEGFVSKLKAQKPHAVLVSLQHMGAWPWIDAVAKSGVPTIVFAPVGVAFTGHLIEISRRPGVHVVSSLDTAAIDQAFRMIRARRQLAASRMLVVAGDKRSETALERLETKIRQVPRSSLHELFDQMPVTDEAREIADAAAGKAKKIVEPNADDLLNAARSFMTAKRLMLSEKANAITTDCLGMVSSRLVPTPPCMAASMFQDAGVTYGCEADLFAAISLMFVSYLFDRPGFQNDPVPETVKNVLITAHCTCGTRLNGFNEPPEPVILRSHSESDLGVATQVLWREGQPVTLVRFNDPNELILDTGTVVGNVDTPPAGGCRTSVEIAMDRVEDSRDVLGFHQVVFYGNHRREVESFCQMYGIKVVNSPQHAPERRLA
jgi:hypothetical protein